MSTFQESKRYPSFLFLPGHVIGEPFGQPALPPAVLVTSIFVPFKDLHLNIPSLSVLRCCNHLPSSSVATTRNEYPQSYFFLSTLSARILPILSFLASELSVSTPPKSLLENSSFIFSILRPLGTYL